MSTAVKKVILCQGIEDSGEINMNMGEFQLYNEGLVLCLSYFLTKLFRATG